MTKEQAAVVAKGLTGPTADALKKLAKKEYKVEEVAEVFYPRWSHFKAALERRGLLKYSKTRGGYSANADGKKVAAVLAKM